MGIKERYDIAREQQIYGNGTAIYQANPQRLKPGFVPRTHCPTCGQDLRIKENCLDLPGQFARCRNCHAKKNAKTAGTYTSGVMSRNAKLTQAQVVEIRRSAENGPTLAVRYGVSESTIYYIRSRRTWK